MENKNKDSIKVSQETHIDLPASRRLFSVDRTDWNRIKKLIRKIDTSNNRWENFGWFMRAALIALVIAAFTTSSNYKLGFLVAAAFSAIIVLIAFLVAHKFSEFEKDSKEDVLNEMDQMEEKKEEDTKISDEKLKILEATYGSKEFNKDITKELNNLILNNKLNIKASNDIAGDPHKGVVKRLNIKYQLNGEEFQKEYNEGDEVLLP